MSRNVTNYVDQSEWDNGGGPFNAAALEVLGLVDVTSTRTEYIRECEGGHTLGYYMDAEGITWRADLQPGDEVWLEEV